ncbi:methyl-accepting chemotaxis protein [Borrelia turicatae]|uniref:Chemotaxis protein n=1 Tax=Borrelia turicatae TaxID=142 RepID=A0A172XBM0_BORTU|nr:methyl-accepting chemotaxis protein [Borrelia turicatae]ANF34056.1 chemotaxis protein [Borrelia turicatae]UPA13427.1 methyl-accepting chemotaxis protein [Borrelia turicatae 91E135]UPA14911.1 methyl-accepting chemotaxis protein [Borrelia turicatae]
MKRNHSSSTLFYKFNIVIVIYTMIIATTIFLLLDHGYRKIITKELQSFTKFVNNIMIKSFSRDTRNMLIAIDDFVKNYNQNLNTQKSDHLNNVISIDQLSLFPSYIKIIEYTNKNGKILYSSDERRLNTYINLQEMKTDSNIDNYHTVILNQDLTIINNKSYIPMLYKIPQQDQNDLYNTSNANIKSEKNMSINHDGYVVLYADILEQIKQLRKNIFMLLERSLLEKGNQHKSSHYFKIYAINSQGDIFGEQDEETLKPIKLSLNSLFENNPKITTPLLNAIAQRKSNYNTSYNNNIISITRLTSSSWYLAIQMNYNNIFSNELNNIKLMSISTIILLVIIFILIMIITIKKLIISKIEKLNKIIPKVKEGDLTIKIESKGKDSISATINYFGYFIENLKNVINSLQGRVKLLKENGDLLFNEINKAYDTITNSNKYIEKTQGEIEKQVEFISNTTNTIENLSKNIASLDNSIETQAASVEESSSAIEEMIGSIQSVTEITQKAAKSTEELKLFSDDGRKKQEEIIMQIKDIYKNSTRLQEANALISSIASQTNLLSMNAAIEASHAGEAGKGFAIVAEEIKDLAEQVTSQSESVAASINEIMDSINQTVKTSELTNKAFNQIFNSINLVVQVIEEINHTMQEQSIGSQEILKALNTMREITYEVKIGSNEMFRGNKEIINTVSVLEEINVTVSNSMKGLKEEIKKLIEAVESIKTFGTTNSNHITEINTDTNQFKTK